VRGACRALGVSEPVTSPTFAIGHRYTSGRLPVSHLDLYRYSGFADADWGDLEPYFDGALVFVEWPEAGSNNVPRPTAILTLSHEGSDVRRIRVEGAATLLEGLA
jgi:tRNA threonylcarbamoyladenosine biosynthesis protein TsaE